MSVQMNTGKPDLAPTLANQVCARGWQDYMMETQFFLGEARVDDSLKGLSTRQLEKLGLSASEVKKVRAR